MWIEIRFSLEMEVQVDQRRMQLVDNAPEEFRIHGAYIPCEVVHAAGAFRAMQVAAIGGFNGNAERRSPLNHPPGYPGKKIPGKEFQNVVKLKKGNQFIKFVKFVKSFSILHPPTSDF